MKNLVLTAKYVKTYLSKASVENDQRIPMFLYTLNGPTEALLKYKEIKSKEGYYSEDDEGNPLWHSNRFVGNCCKVIMTEDGKIFKDNDDILKANSMIDQLPNGELKKALAEIYAKKLCIDLENIGNMLSHEENDKIIEDIYNDYDNLNDL